MTDRTAPAPVAGAIETLVAELEREHAWLEELRADTERAERSCQNLLQAVEAALNSLPVPERRRFYIRIMRMRNETKPMGRPVSDPRRRMVLHLLAERGQGEIGNAEVRAHLGQHGHDANSGYVGRLMSTLAHDGALTRLSMGRYAINGSNPRLQSLRWRLHAEEARAELQESRERMLAGPGEG